MDIRYKQNNFKLSLFFIIFIILFSCCAVAIQNPDKYITVLTPSTIIVILVSISGLIVSPYLCYFLLKWIVQSKYGLRISEEGIYNNSYFLKNQFIPWKEIIDISNQNKPDEKRIKILVKKPLNYLEGSDVLTKFFMKMQIKSSGTPIYINPYFLKASKEELFETLIKEWEKRK
ncbi:STM3941 family protein [Faecalibacter bovis]|uniref:YcxB family protein n=1 Tax=Faecalibacter bovis TaxID=2898187 RepID=A0ABX7XA47_9FLAO|nr:STM3941 family protein [Faecalibacter bovis]QTV04771.1 hypothetical protein J9309_08115 [Faecalibacter bovis]